MKQLYNLNTPAASHHDLPFAIHSIRCIEDNYLSKSNAHRNDHFMIVWVTKGPGNYTFGQQKGILAINHLLFVKPGQPGDFKLTQGLDGYVISFTSAFLDLADKDTESIFNTLYRLFAHSCGIGISHETLDDMQCIVAMMAREFTTNNLHRSEILKRYFKIFLIYLSRQSDVPSPTFRQSRNEELLDNFMQLLESNFRTKKMVADYADQLAVSPNYLNEVIKKVTGHSAGYHIRQRVALEAKRLSMYSNNCMKNIAYDLGFYDLAHFSKFFKNTTGMYFSDFKKKDMVLQPVA